MYIGGQGEFRAKNTYISRQTPEVWWFPVVRLKINPFKQKIVIGATSTALLL